MSSTNFAVGFLLLIVSVFCKFLSDLSASAVIGCFYVKLEKIYASSQSELGLKHAVLCAQL